MCPSFPFLPIKLLRDIKIHDVSAFSLFENASKFVRHTLTSRTILKMPIIKKQAGTSWILTFAHNFIDKRSNGRTRRGLKSTTCPLVPQLRKYQKNCATTLKSTTCPLVPQLRKCQKNCAPNVKIHQCVPMCTWLGKLGGWQRQSIF